MARSLTPIVLAAAFVALTSCFYNFEEPFADSNGAGGEGGASTSTSSGKGSSSSSKASASSAKASSGSSTSSESSSSAGDQGVGSTTASSSTGGAATASSSTGGGTEVCTNNKDDDGDGLVDCADPDCMSAGYACVTDAPSGFNGPYLFYIGAPGSSPACPNNAQTLIAGHSGAIDASQAQCAKCTCDGAKGVACGTPTFTASQQTDCTSGQTNMLQPKSCFTLGGGANKFQSVMLSPDVTSYGSCQQEGGTATIAPPTFQEDVVVCDAATGGGCKGGACAPSVPSFSVCYEAPGDVSCPQGMTKTSIFESVDDTRSCTMCGCGKVAVSCNDSVTLFQDPDCNFMEESIPDDGSCATLKLFLNQAYTYVPGTPSGSCTPDPTGGQPTGSATPAMLHTICCP